MSGLHAAESSLDAVSSPKVVSAEEKSPGSEVDNAVQMAQEEIRDPFAKILMPEPEPPPSVVPVEAVPTVAVPQVIAPEIKVELQGIGFGNKAAYAVIGGEIFHEGDEKQGIKLLEVRKREVDILMNGGKVTVPLFEDQELQRMKARAEEKRSGGKASGI